MTYLHSSQTDTLIKSTTAIPEIPGNKDVETQTEVAFPRVNDTHICFFLKTPSDFSMDSRPVRIEQSEIFQKLAKTDDPETVLTIFREIIDLCSKAADRKDSPYDKSSFFALVFAPMIKSLSQKKKASLSIQDFQRLSLSFQHGDLIRTMMGLYYEGIIRDQDDFNCFCTNQPPVLRLSTHEDFVFKPRDAVMLAQALQSHKTLKKLNLYGKNIGSAGIEALARALSHLYEPNTILTSLNLGGSRTNERSHEHNGVLAFARVLKTNTTLTKLDLSGNQIQSETMTFLAEALRENTTLKKLNLNQNSISHRNSEDMFSNFLPDSFISAISSHPALTKLSLSTNRLKYLEIKDIASILKVNTILTQIDLGNNQAGNEGAKVIAEALRDNRTVTSLILKWNQIGVIGIEALADTLKYNNTLTELDLENNPIGAEGARALAEALKDNKTLKHLNLGKSHIGAEGAKFIAEALTQNSTLTSLNLDFNQIGAEGAKAIAEALTRNHTLINLSFSYNELRTEGAKTMTKSLTQNTTLRKLDLSFNQFGADGMSSLAMALTKNTTLLDFSFGDAPIAYPDDIISNLQDSERRVPERKITAYGITLH